MSPPPRTNVTGFDINKLVRATKVPDNDPWHRAEIWRTTGPFSKYNRLKGALPGLGTATVAFAAYCTYEYFFLDKGEHGHDHKSKEHGEGHH